MRGDLRRCGRLLDDGSTLLGEHARGRVLQSLAREALTAAAHLGGRAERLISAAGAAACGGSTGRRGAIRSVAAAQQGGAATGDASPAAAQGASAAGAAAAGAAGRPQPQHTLQTWAAVPGVAKALGLAGLIPFVGLTPQVVAHIPLLPPDLLANAPLLQVTYGATIASFLGGVHWGAAMLDPRQGAAKAALERYLWGVTPCLMAFPAVLFPGGPGAFIVATTLGLCHIVDRSFWRRGLLPPWYMSLRLPLTTLAITGLGITVAGDFMGELQPAEDSCEKPEHDA